jgi:hypothetical protein
MVLRRPNNLFDVRQGFIGLGVWRLQCLGPRRILALLACISR